MILSGSVGQPPPPPRTRPLPLIFEDNFQDVYFMYRNRHSETSCEIASILYIQILCSTSTYTVYLSIVAPLKLDIFPLIFNCTTAYSRFIVLHSKQYMLLQTTHTSFEQVTKLRYAVDTSNTYTRETVDFKVNQCNVGKGQILLCL